MRARELAETFGPAPSWRRAPLGPSLLEDIYPAAELVASAPMHGGGNDSFGRRVYEFVIRDGQEMGLYEDDYAELWKLASRLQSSAKLTDLVSLDFIADRIFEWVEKEAGGRAEDRSEPDAKDMVKALLQRCSDAIQIYNFTIPISGLRIEEPFRFGKVVFHTLGGSVIDDIEKLMLKPKMDGETEAVVTQYLRTTRARFQGRAAISVSVEAEADHARNVAVALAAESLSILRTYHPSHLTPESPALCSVNGHEYLKSETVFVGESGNPSKIVEQGASSPPVDWGIPRQELEGLRRHGLDTLGAMLAKDTRSELEDKLLHAIRLYSEGVLKHTITERLLYYLAALESLLLKSSTENVQKSVGERLAFFLETDADKRIAIVKNVAEVYAHRSRFVHHGELVEYHELLDGFCSTVMAFFLRLVQVSPQYDTKDALLEVIERAKFS